jgi:protease IV
MRKLSAALALACVAAGCTGRARTGTFAENGTTSSLEDFFSGAQGDVVEVDLSDGAPESLGSESPLFSLPPERSYVGLVRTLERERKDTSARAFFVELGSESFGWARSAEIGRLLGALRKKNRPIVCHADSLTNSSEWLLARACDRIWLSPAAEVDTVGIAAQMVYFKDVLDKLQVQVDFIHMGKYKSAAEPLTRSGPSDPARLSLTDTLASIRQSWLDSMRGARKAATVQAALEHGPWSAGEAKAQGLVDEVGYGSDALDDAKKCAHVKVVDEEFGPKATPKRGLDIAELIRFLSGAEGQLGGTPHVAVVPADGEITMSGGGLLSFGSGGITEQDMRPVLKRLEKDDSVRAVVLRIDSPGGSALASDLIWHELRKLEKKKPLIVSVGEMAASGGYYMASAADRIVAERTSIVGSIGVLGGKVAIAPALAKFGVNSVTFPASPEPGAAARAAYESLLTPWDDATRERVRQSMQKVYDLFLSRVAEGRKMKIDAVQAIAQGRIWSGAQGKKNGLVDEIGGLDAALVLAKKLGKLSDDAPVTVEGTSRGLIERYLMSDPNARAAAQSFTNDRSKPSPLTPFVPASLRPFVGALAPMLHGEHALTALPFALVVR